MSSVQIAYKLIFLKKRKPTNGYFKPSAGLLNGDPYGN